VKRKHKAEMFYWPERSASYSGKASRAMSGIGVGLLSGKCRRSECQDARRVGDEMGGL
jgi:hypothetical protein